MTRRMLLVALLVAAVPGMTQTDSSIYQTEGFTNGRAWVKLSESDKVWYLSGYADAKNHSRSPSCPTELELPSGTIREHREFLDKFFQVPENRALSVPKATFVFIMKLNGDRDAKIDYLIRTWRHMAADPNWLPLSPDEVREAREAFGDSEPKH